MSTLSRATVAIPVTVGRPGSLPCTWATPKGQPIDMTGFQVSAAFRWTTLSQRVETEVAVEIVAAEDGAFRIDWTSGEVDELGADPDLLISITDTAGAVHDCIYPVAGQRL